MSTSPRTVWVRPLAGNLRDGVRYYWTTAPHAEDDGWVGLPLVFAPTIPPCAVEPLGTVAADAVVTWSVVPTQLALDVLAPDLGATPRARRLGSLSAYVTAAANNLTVAGWTGSDGDLIQIDREVMTAGVLSGSTLPVTRTARQAHRTSYTRPTPIIRADMAPLRGQWVEVGYTEDGADVTQWRGVIDRIESAGVVTMTARSLLSVVREHQPIVPRSLDQGARVFPTANFGDGRDATVVFQYDQREYDGPWPYVRIVSASGAWAILEPTYRDDIEQAGNSNFTRAGFDISDSPVIVVGSGDNVRAEESGSTAEVFAVSVAEDLASVEFGVFADGDVSTAIESALTSSGGAPSGFHAGLPVAWVSVPPARDYRPRYMPILPGGKVGDYLGTWLLGPSGLFLSQDMGEVVTGSWVEGFRPELPEEITPDSAADRSTWAWVSEAAPVTMALSIDDQSTAARYTTRQRAFWRVRVGETITEGPTSALIIDADAWLDAAGNTHVITAPAGVSLAQRTDLESMLRTWAVQVPAVTIAMRDVGAALGHGVLVELPDAPTSRSTVGLIYQVGRDTVRGTMTVTVALPGLGRDPVTAWGASLDVGEVDGSEADVTGDTDLTYPTTLAVYSPAAELRGTLTGATLTGSTLAWTGGTASATIAEGDTVTMPPRTPVLDVPGSALVYGYAVDVTEEDGDARWQ